MGSLIFLRSSDALTSVSAYRLFSVKPAVNVCVPVVHVELNVVVKIP